MRCSIMLPMGADKSKLYEALFELSQSISGHSDLQSLCRALSSSLRRVLDFDLLGLLIFNGASNSFQVVGLNLSGTTGEENAYSRVVGASEHPAGQVWNNQQPLLISRLDHETRWPGLLTPVRDYGISSLLLVPLTTGDRRLGVLALGFTDCCEASEDEIDFIHRVASEFSVTIDSFLTRKQYLRERDRLQLLFDLTNALVSKLSSDDLFSAMADQLHKVVAFDIVGVTVLDRITGELTLRDFRMEGNRHLDLDRTPRCVDGTPTGEAIATGRPVVVEEVDFERFPSPLYREFAEAGFVAACSIPLISPNSTLGTIELARKNAQKFSEEDVDLLVQIARQIAIAVENSLAYRELSAIKEKLANEKLYLEDEIRFDQNLGEMLGESPAFQIVLKNIQIVGPTEATVLILGETGTGKEMVARAIHQRSDRCKNSFIRVNCAAIPSSLLESELFGHEKGAFTGALGQRIGRFELAHQGTLFLDEVGEIPLELQSKLLRAIQEQEFERLGGNRTIRVSVRFVAASNRNLKAMVDAGTFRSDLYYRLHVFPLMLPPLRDRREDIPLLARYFIQKYSQRMGRNISSIPAGAMDSLLSYGWPGNIRELQNVIERSVILSRSRALELAMPETDAGPRISKFVRANELESEKDRILQVLRESRGLVSGPNGAAQRLGLKRTTLQARMKKLGITRDYQ
jgi:formate hydrogenlyase transcriptional activator